MPKHIRTDSLISALHAVRFVKREAIEMTSVSMVPDLLISEYQGLRAKQVSCLLPFPVERIMREGLELFLREVIWIFLTIRRAISAEICSSH